MLECNKCNEEIAFDDRHVSARGKKIPLDADTMEPHNCPENNIPCKACGEMIHFDSNVRSESSGKLIPLEPYSSEPHECEGDKAMFRKEDMD